MRERNFTLEPSHGSAEKSLKRPLQSRLRASSGGCLWGDLLHFADIGVTFRSTRRDGSLARETTFACGGAFCPSKSLKLVGFEPQMRRSDRDRWCLVASDVASEK